MTNTALNNKRYGFNAEAELLEYLRDHGFTDVERLHLAGQEDEGDLVCKLYGTACIVQLKTFSSRSKSGVERPLTPGKVKVWQTALLAQVDAYKAHRKLSYDPAGILIVKFKGSSWDDALVIQTLGRWAG